MGNFLSLTEAARRAGVTDTSVRRWLSSGKLKARKSAVGEWEIDPDVLQVFLATEAPNRRGTVVSVVSSAPPPQESGYVEALATVKETLARERQINDELRTELRELRSENKALQAELRAFLSGEHESTLSRWMRSAANAEFPPTVTQPYPQTPPPTENKILKTLEVSPSDFRATVVPADVVTSKSEVRSPTLPPTLSAFAKRVLELSADGQSPEQIAKTLKKNVANVRAVLSAHVNR